MNAPVSNIPKSMAVALLLSLTAILFGFGLGGVFGAAEDSIKGTLKDSGAAVLDTTYKGDKAAMDAVVSKSWSYMKRAHLHGGAIGTASLASILALLLLARRDKLAQGSALAFGLGGLLYGVFWMAAGFMAPGLGSTDAAKEALRFLAIPGAGLSILGLLGTLVAIARDTLGRTPPAA